MSKWYVPCIILLLENEKEPESWKRLYVRGTDGISCQLLQVLVTHLLQKHWEWQEDRKTMIRHGSVIRATMFVASMDTKPTFDVA